MKTTTLSELHYGCDGHCRWNLVKGGIIEMRGDMENLIHC